MSVVCSLVPPLCYHRAPRAPNLTSAAIVARFPRTGAMNAPRRGRCQQARRMVVSRAVAGRTQSSHAEGVHVLSVTQRELARRSLDHEAQLLIEMHGGGGVCVSGQ